MHVLCRPFPREKRYLVHCTLVDCLDSILNVVYLELCTCIQLCALCSISSLCSKRYCLVFVKRKTDERRKSRFSFFGRVQKKWTKSPPSPLSFHVLCSKNACYEVLIILLLFFLTLNQWTFLIFGSQCSLTNVRCSWLKGTVNQSHTFSIVYRPTLEYDKKHNFQ